MRRRHRNRRLRRAALFGLRVGRRHSFSLLSAGVLAAVFALAMTSASFETGETSESAARADAASAPRSTATSGIIPLAAPATASRAVVYYFVGSAKQRNEIAMAIHADANHLASRGQMPSIVTSNIFIVVQDYRDEAEALEFLRQLAAVPPADGTTIRVVDLR